MPSRAAARKVQLLADCNEITECGFHRLTIRLVSLRTVPPSRKIGFDSIQRRSPLRSAAASPDSASSSIDDTAKYRRPLGQILTSKSPLPTPGSRQYQVRPLEKSSHEDRPINR